MVTMVTNHRREVQQKKPVPILGSQTGKPKQILFTISSGGKLQNMYLTREILRNMISFRFRCFSMFFLDFDEFYGTVPNFKDMFSLFFMNYGIGEEFSDIGGLYRFNRGSYRAKQYEATTAMLLDFVGHFCLG